MKINYGLALGFGFMLFGLMVYLIPQGIAFLFVVSGLAIIWKREQINAQLGILDVFGVAPQIDASALMDMLSKAMPIKAKAPKEQKKKKVKKNV